jgi:hypothetical protein
MGPKGVITTASCASFVVLPIILMESADILDLSLCVVGHMHYTLPSRSTSVVKGGRRAEVDPLPMGCVYMALRTKVAAERELFGSGCYA